MIENIQPRRLVIGSITTSYTNAFINHSSVIDEDAAGKVFWTTISGYTESGHIVVPGVQLNFSKLTGLEPSSLYGISGAFFDAMADSELLEAKSGVSISDEFIVSTKTAPSITSIEQTSTQVDIGITDPRLTFTIGGDATSYILEYSLDLGTSWTPVSSTSNKISIPLPANDYTFRVSGVIVLPTSTEISDPIEYSEGVFTVEGGSSVPAAPTSLSASIGRIQTSFERFDVRLSWLWDRGTTGNIKEFIVKGYPTASVYSFTNPLVMTSAGTSLETVLIDIQKNLQMVFRVDALGYDDTLVSSETLTLTVTDDTVDTDYEEASGVEVTYAGIKAFTIDDNNVQTESFSLDAATGSVAIGYIDPQLGAPIRFDPVTGYVTVQGAVIANEIVSASFVMSQLTSSDRPSIRTTNKFNYADYNSGLYMGYNTDTGNPSFQFDMGSETEHIRWDGSNLYISGDVSIGTPGNATPLTQIGVDSTRYYNQEVVNFDGTFDEASAELYVLNLLVGSIIPVGSVVTQYDSVDYSKSKSAMWEDGGWTVPTVFINGSLMATQSITGDSINSNTILTGHIDARSLTFIDSATDSLPTEIDNSNAISTASTDATEKAEAAQNNIIDAHIGSNLIYGSLNEATDGVKVIGSPYETFTSPLEVDFGVTRYISESRAYFYAQDGRHYLGYYISYSVDGVTWSSIGSPSDSRRPGTYYPNGMEFPTITGLGVYARYVRLHSSGNTVNTSNHVYEWELWSAGQGSDPYNDVGDRIYPTQSKLQISGGGYEDDQDSGWGIHQNGTAVFNDAFLRGTVYATDGEFTGAITASTIDGSTITGGTLVGTKIYAGGVVYAADPYDNGTIVYYPSNPSIPVYVEAGPFFQGGSFGMGSSGTVYGPILPFRAAADLSVITEIRQRWPQVASNAIEFSAVIYTEGVDAYLRCHLAFDLVANNGNVIQTSSSASTDVKHPDDPRSSPQSISFLGIIIYVIIKYVEDYSYEGSGYYRSGKFEIEVTGTGGTFGSTSNSSYNGILRPKFFITGNSSINITNSTFNSYTVKYNNTVHI